MDDRCECGHSFVGGPEYADHYCVVKERRAAEIRARTGEPAGASHSSSVAERAAAFEATYREELAKVKVLPVAMTLDELSTPARQPDIANPDDVMERVEEIASVWQCEEIGSLDAIEAIREALGCQQPDRDPTKPPSVEEVLACHRWWACTPGVTEPDALPLDVVDGVIILADSIGGPPMPFNPSDWGDALLSLPPARVHGRWEGEAVSYLTTRLVACDPDDGWEIYAEPWPIDDRPNVRITFRRARREPLTAILDLAPADARAFGKSILRAANKRKP